MLCSKQRHEMVPDNVYSDGSCKQCRHDRYTPHKIGHCKRGHPWPENKDGRGRCWQCKKDKPSSLWHSWRQRAAKRGLAVTITVDQYNSLRAMPCFYCGGRVDGNRMGGVDRIDSDVGYAPGNCRPCCRSCNQAKSTMTTEEFQAWVRRVYLHWANIIQLKVLTPYTELD